MKSRSVTALVLVTGLLAAITSGVCAADTDAPVSALKPIDPQRYLGRWYEVARVPNAFQKDCATATSDWSPSASGLYDVVQTCPAGAPKGPAKVWRGAGRVLDQSEARIRIAFFGGFFKQDYVVVDRSDDYSWCILSTAKPKYIWIMSRQPALEPSQRTALAARARQLGLDISRLVYDQPS